MDKERKAYLDEIIERARKASKEFSKFSQKKVDEIVKRAALAGNDARIPLAEMAVEETGMGVVEDKVIKNHFATEYIYNHLRKIKSCGVLYEDKINRLKVLAEPVGVVIAVIPVTNPTSTAMFKALINLKARNAVIFSPHPRAARCTAEAVKIIKEAAVAADAPEDVLLIVENPSIEDTAYLMSQGDLVLATGGPSLVKAAYSSGKPALGVGPGNTPVYFHKSVDLERALDDLMKSKTFDNGVVCACESNLIIDEDIYDVTLKALIERKCHLMTEEQAKKVGELMETQLGKICGQYAWKIAEMAGFEVPKDPKVLLAKGNSETIGPDPLSHEKLSPVLTLYKVSDEEEAVEMMNKILANAGGLGHTAVVHATDKEVIEYVTKRVPVGRMLVNQPASQGAIGDIYNFGLTPSLTLGCGTWGGNSTTANVNTVDLINKVYVADRGQNIEWFRIPPRIYWGPGSISYLKSLSWFKRAAVITDPVMVELGYAKRVRELLEEAGLQVSVFSEVEPDPTIRTVRRITEFLNTFNADLIVTLGGGSPIDAAKAAWLFYELPEVDFKDVAERFMDIRKRVFKLPKLGKKAQFVAIPTTSGTGSEVSPVPVITDEDGQKYPLMDCGFTPWCAIIDSDLVMTLPKKLTAITGMDALSHAVEAYVSTMASDFTDLLAMKAIEYIFKYLPVAYREPGNREAREKMHNASTLAGIAFANAGLGICHSLSHKIWGAFHVPHGLANAIILPYVVEFNGEKVPEKYSTWPRYKVHSAGERYAEIFERIRDYIEDEDVKRMKPGPKALAEAVRYLSRTLELPLSFKDAGVPENEFFEFVNDLSKGWGNFQTYIIFKHILKFL